MVFLEEYGDHRFHRAIQSNHGIRLRMVWGNRRVRDPALTEKGTESFIFKLCPIVRVEHFWNPKAQENALLQLSLDGLRVRLANRYAFDPLGK